MRLIDKPFSGQKTQSARELASPRGSWPEGPERARNGNGGQRPPTAQPSLAREGVDEVDGWDD